MSWRGIATGYNPKARRMPLVVGIPGVVLSMVEVARQTLGQRRSGGVKAAAIITGQQGSQTEVASHREGGGRGLISFASGAFYLDLLLLQL